MNVYNFPATTQNGSEISLAHYKVKVLLIVNTATGCSFTPQYTQLQELYSTYQHQGFEFPCHRFGTQVPGNDEEIYAFYTGRFGITFPQFSKVDVNGENAAPLFQ